ncbi:putative ribonuclease H-like domain-containing protein [Tanacetum coccineum]|uniref:Ribonuclease H-like domain-containing protein n=1 Tax=Tanacetum coccineum TaxID=301880 RepID=A0ABQ4XM36_9ASTR
MYSVDLKNIVPKGGLTCLFAKATSDESKLWHRRLGHLNFKTMNKLVKGNLVRGLPSKLFENDETCVACQKGKQHRASCTKLSDNAGQARKEIEPVKDYIFLPLWTVPPPFSQDLKSSYDDGSKPSSDDGKKVDEDPRKDSEYKDQEKEDNVNSTNNVNAASTNKVNVVGGKTSIKLPDNPNMSALEDYSIFDFTRDDEDDDAETGMNNLDTTIQVSHIPTTRIHKDHPLDQVIGDLQSATQTRRMSKNLEEHGIEAIRLFLAHASFKDFVVYQMDVKSTFLYGKIKEEVYVCQPPGFEDLYFPDKVYKVKKTLYGLHQALRAWYETLSTYLLDNEFQRGKIDKTLFIKRYKGDILLVQVYVDDIIFGSTKKELCNEFEKLMHEKFQMSSMEELTFFLGLQVQQKKDGIFISQDKYVGEILKKFGFIEVKTASTPMETQKPLLKDEDGEEVDVHMYRSMIGSLMYLTSSRPNIMFVVCACARYQVNPNVSHLHAVKRIFSLDRKSITGGCQFLRSRLISWLCKKQTVVANSTTQAEYVAASKKAKKSVRLMMEKLVIRENRQRVLVRKRIERIGENKNRKRESVWNGIGVNAGDSKLMLLGINLILLVKVNAARHKLTTADES